MPEAKERLGTSAARFPQNPDAWDEVMGRARRRTRRRRLTAGTLALVIASAGGFAVVHAFRSASTVRRSPLSSVSPGPSDVTIWVQDDPDLGHLELIQEEGRIWLVHEGVRVASASAVPEADSSISLGVYVFGGATFPGTTGSDLTYVVFGSAVPRVATVDLYASEISAPVQFFTPQPGVPDAHLYWQIEVAPYEPTVPAPQVIATDEVCHVLQALEVATGEPAPTPGPADCEPR